MEITYGIILFTVVVSIFCFNNEELFSKLKFNAFDVKHSNQWYRFFSYGFLHANWVHLLINMAVLYSFGGIVERTCRVYFHEKYILYFILLYMGGLLLSIIPAFGKHKNDVFYNAVGASGAVSSVVFASIILFPLARIGFFFIPIDLPAWVFGLLYLGYEFFMGRKGKDNIGHDAHFWGAIYGVVFIIILRPQVVTAFLKFLGLMS